MKEVLLFAVIVVTAVLAADPRCLQRTETYSSNLIHDHDCRKYYVCDDNQQITGQQCPDNLEFNPLLLKCDYPRGFCTPTTNKLVQNVMSCNGLSDGPYYPDVSNECRSFYYCRSGIPKVAQCSEGTKFEWKTRKCTDETTVKCNADAKKMDLDCTETKADTRYGCKAYNECRNGKAVRKFCEGSLIFNDKIQSCDWPQNVQCGSRNSKQRSNDVVYMDFDEKSCESKSNGYIVGPNRNTKCASYYTCKNGKLVEQYCGDRLVFNGKLGICDLPENVKSCDVDFERKSIIDCTHKHDLRYQHPDDCSAYITCRVGRARLHKCTKGQRFDGMNHVCVKDKDNKCWDSSDSSSNHLDFFTEPSKKDHSHHRKTNSYANYANGCRSYFECKKSDCKERHCLRDFAYNTETLRCEPEDNIFCDPIDNSDESAGIVEAIGNSSSRGIKGRASVLSYIDCSVTQGTWFPDDSDPTAFYVCVCGTAIHQKCHEGQIFDRVRKLCRCGTTETSKPPIITAPTVSPTTATTLTTRPTTPSTPRPTTPSTPRPTTPSTPRPTTPSTTPATTPLPKCQNGDKQPNAFDKSKYYQCENGFWREKSCPPGEIFYSYNSSCAACPTAPKCTEGNVEKYPDDDKKFKVCINGTWTIVSCATGTTFNETAGTCVGSPSESACKDGVRIPSYWDPTKYYECQNKTWIEQSCGEGEIFRPSNNSCVSCSPVTPCKDGETKPYIGNEAMYYNCSNGEWILQHCPDNWIFVENKCIDWCGGGNSTEECKTGDVEATDDPREFKACLDGSWQIVRCFNGSIFNPSSKTCECEDSITTTTTIPTTSSKPTGPTCTDGNRLPNVFDEHTYYECRGGVWKLISCVPSSYVYDHATRVCVNPSTTVASTPSITTPASNITTPSTVPTTTVTTKPTSIPTTSPTTDGCVEGEIYPDNFNNTKFYVCYQGRLRSQNCPTKMVFNPMKKYCEIANIACGNIPNGGFAPASTPNAYYICYNGEMVLQLCPEGQLFYPSLGYCSKFRPKPPIRPPPPPPPPPPSLDCGPVKQGEFVADAVNETKYWVCIFGKLWPQQCPSGMVFNNQTLNCVSKPTVAPQGGCGQYSPGERIPVCDTNLPNYYLVCVMGVFVIQQCPDGYNFNANTKNCSTVAGPGGPGLSCGLYGDGDMWPYQNMPNQYYQCLDGSSVVRTCPDGLIFNQGSNFCLNPCTSFDKPDLYPTYFVGDPNDPSYYYQCNGPYVVTSGTTGTPTSPSAITTAQRAQCPSGEQFYPALGSLSSAGSGCMSPTDLLALCPPSPSTYAAIPIFPTMKITSTPDCTTFTLTPYYLECRNGTDVIVQRCPRGAVLYDGSCMDTQNACTSTSIIPSAGVDYCICA